MIAPAKQRGTAGFYDPRGRLDSSRLLERIARALPGGLGTSYADSSFVVASSPGSGVHVAGERCVLVDGRIENRRSLAAQLDLKEDAAPETVVHAAGAAWPGSAAGRLRGSFVVATWDRQRRAGELTVDQLGGRSLFYTVLPDGTLAFGSEVVTLLALLPTRPVPSAEAIAGWLLEIAAPHGSTMYEGVRRLGAARTLELRADGRRERVYWTPQPERPLRGDRAELAEALWQEVVRAVGAKVDQGDTPAVILSGGIDSSVAAAAAADAATADGKSRPRAYSAVFPDMPDIDESDRIDLVVDALDLDGVQLHLRPSGALALALEYVARWSLPLSGPGSALEQPLVERAGAEGATVILDGQAGDEVFGRSPYLIADRLRRGRLLSTLRLVDRLLPDDIGRRDRYRYTLRALKILGLQPALPHLLHRGLRRLRARPRTLPGWFAAPSGSFGPLAPDPWLWKANGGPRWWAYQVFMMTQLRDIIAVSDYIRHRGWVVGADSRPPLLDVDLIEFVLRLPPELGFDADLPDRPLIREAMRGHIPDAVRLNPVKSNVAAFYYENLSGPDFEPISRLLTDPAAETAAYTRPGGVEELLGRPPGVGNPNWYEWFSAVWRLATLEVWLRQERDASFAAGALADPAIVPTIRSDHRVRRAAADSSFSPPSLAARTQ